MEKEQIFKVPIEVSARHCHLSQPDLEKLFGAGQELKEMRQLSMPSDFAAEEKVGLKMNVRKEDLKNVLARLPALKKPTISGLSDDGWFAIETIIDEKVVRILIPALKAAGAQGIIEYPLNKVIY